MTLRTRQAFAALLLLFGCAAPVPTDASLTVDPGRLTVPPGAEASATLTFSAPDTENWSLTLSHPTGVSVVSGSGILRSGDAVMLRVSTDSSAALGDSTVQFEASRSGASPVTADLVVNVPGSTGGGGGGGGGAAGGGGATGGGGGGSATGGGGGATGGGGGGGATGGGVGSATDVTIYVEPSDNAAALIAAIRGATRSVHMTMYILSNSTIVTALINQHSAGRDVKVVLNQNFPGGAGSNQAVFTQLQSAGVPVHWAPSTFTLTHEKTVILDGTSAWIMTMNAAGSSPTANREYLAADREPADVAEAEAIFAADFAGTTWTPAGPLIVSPVNSRASLVNLIRSAVTTIDMEAEELSDANVASALANRADNGVRVQIVLCDNAPSSAQASAVAMLKTHGVHLVTVSTPYIHAKSIVVDGSVAYVGSENFTAASLLYNRELGLLVSAPAEVTKVLTTTRSDFGRGTAL